MLSGLMIFTVAVLLLCVSLVMAFVRIPRCPKCRVPLELVAETVRELGLYGVETVMHYECSDCYEATRRRFILTHIG
jgi:hypothetical protein